MCVMEMVSFLAGESWSDMPMCASPALARFCQGINDKFGQAERDQLQKFVPMLIGTRSPEHEQDRAEVLAWGAVRKFAPFWLRKAGQHADADRLAAFSGTMEEAKAAAAYANAAAARAAYAADAYAAAAAYAADAAARAAYAADAFAAAAYAANAANAYAYAAAANAANAYAAAAVVAAAKAAAANAMVFPLVLEVLREAIEAGPHGTAYTDIHLERGAELARVMEAQS